MNKKSDIVETTITWGICLVSLLVGACLLIPLITGQIEQNYFDVLLVSIVLLADSVVFFPPFQISKFVQYITIGFTLMFFGELF